MYSAIAESTETPPLPGVLELLEQLEKSIRSAIESETLLKESLGSLLKPAEDLVDVGKDSEAPMSNRSDVQKHIASMICSVDELSRDIVRVHKRLTLETS